MGLPEHKMHVDEDKTGRRVALVYYSRHTLYSQESCHPALAASVPHVLQLFSDSTRSVSPPPVKTSDVILRFGVALFLDNLGWLPGLRVDCP